MQRMVNFLLRSLQRGIECVWCAVVFASTAVHLRPHPRLVHAVAGEQPLMNLSEEALRRSAEYKRAIPQIILVGSRSQ